MVWVNMSQGTFHRASWRGIQVAVKRLGDEVISDEDKVWVAFRLRKAFAVHSFPSFNGL